MRGEGGREGEREEGAAVVIRVQERTERGCKARVVSSVFLVRQKGRDVRELRLALPLPISAEEGSPDKRAMMQAATETPPKVNCAGAISAQNNRENKRNKSHIWH